MKLIEKVGYFDYNKFYQILQKKATQANNVMKQKVKMFLLIFSINNSLTYNCLRIWFIKNLHTNP